MKIIRTISISLSYVLFFTLLSNGQTIVNLEGNIGTDNTRTLKILDNHIYQAIVIEGKQGLRKLDLNGNEIWSLGFGQDLFVNDFTKVGNEIMCVGGKITNPNSFSARDSYIMKVIDNGNTAVVNFIKDYTQSSSRDYFVGIMPYNGNYLINGTYSSSGDNNGIIELDSNGNIIQSFGYDSSDTQLWNGKIKDGPGHLTLTGNLGGTTTGSYMELDSNFDVVQLNTYTNIQAIYNYLNRPADRKIIIGYTSDQEAFIGEVDQNGNGVWAKKMPGRRILTQVILGSYTTVSNGFVETYYVSGQTSAASDGDRFIAKIKYTNTSNGGGSSLRSSSSAQSVELEWIKLIQTNETINGSSYFDINNNLLVYSDNRDDSTIGFGDTDILTSISNLEFETCSTVETDEDLVDISLIPIPKSVTTLNYTIPNIVDVTPQALISYGNNPICDPDFSCDASCDTTTLNLSTGYDADGNALPSNQHQSKWEVIGVPPSSGVNLPLFPYILNTPSSWSDIPSAKYISPFPNVQNNFDNIANGTSFDFETCFCVCEQNSTVTIDMSAYADNAVDIDLYNDSSVGGSFMMDLLEIPASEGTGAFNGSTFDASHTLNLNTGKYCLKAALQNDGTVYMGMSMNATVSGAGLITAACCGQNNGATGFAYDDKDCDGNYNMHKDKLLPSMQIDLLDNQGSVVSTTYTDTLGLYTFAGLDPGTYSVTYAANPNYELVESPSGQFTIDEDDVIGRLEFGFNNIGPIETEPMSTTCAPTDGSLTFEWCGQSCSCQMELYIAECGTNNLELIASFDNTRKFKWDITDEYVGDYEFYLMDCDGNTYPFDGCVTIGKFSLLISSSKVDCGTYEFNSLLTGSTAAIVEYSWTFGDYLTSSSVNPIQEFPEAGLIEVCLTVETADGCVITECQGLNVLEGSNDDCTFCPPFVLGEIDQGDMYIHQSCFGVILKSPNGNCFRIQVTDSGDVVSQPISCP